VKAVLINVTPEGKSKKVPITHDRTVLGRLDDCQLRIPSGRVSRHHCEIVHEDGTLTLRDLGSSNGTYLNQSKITEKELSAGDLIAVGSLVFLVQIDGEPGDFDPEFLYEDGIPESDAAPTAGEDRGSGQGSGQAPGTAPSTQKQESARVNAPTSSGDDSSMMDFNFEFDLDDDDDLDEQPPL